LLALCTLALHKSQLGLQSWQRPGLLTLTQRRLQALLRLWMPLHTSPGLLPLLRLQEPLQQWKSQVPLKLKSLQKNLRMQRLQMPLGMHKSPLELQSWLWPALCKLALHKLQLGLQSWLWQVLCTLTPRTSLPLLPNDDDRGVFCDDHDGALYGSLSLPSRLQALLRLWMSLHMSPELLPLLRLQEPLRQWRSQVPLKLKSRRMTLRTQMLQMPLELHKSQLELQLWLWLALCRLALTLHTLLPPRLNDDDHGVFCDDHDGALYASLSLPSRLPGLLRLWMMFRRSRGPLPLLRLQEPLR
jgi:hypothetical protein